MAGCWTVSDVDRKPQTAERGGGDSVSASLAELVALMRERGASVGVGQLLGGMRALYAIGPADCNSSRLALRAARCSSRRDVAVFDDAWLTWLARGEQLGRPAQETIA